jgi:hypothetical protein
VQGAFEKTTQVLGNGDVRIGRLCESDVGSTWLKRRKKPLKLDSEKLLVQPTNGFEHKGTVQFRDDWLESSAANSASY